MGLLSTDIAKVKRLSLREVKLPAPPDQPAPKTVPVEQPYTQEEEIYSRMVDINPLLGSLVDLLDLHSQDTGKRLRRAEKRPKNVQYGQSMQEDEKPRKNPEKNEPLQSGKTTEKRPKNYHTGEPLHEAENGRKTVEKQPGNRLTLATIAQRILQPEKSYNLEEVITRLQDGTGVDRSRAERGAEMMIQAGVIETINQGLYYLAGSTPF